MTLCRYHHFKLEFEYNIYNNSIMPNKYNKLYFYITIWHAGVILISIET